MCKPFTIVLAAAFLMPLFILHAQDTEENPLVAVFGKYAKQDNSHDRYKEITYNELKASKKELEHKRAWYEGAYMGFNDTFPHYVEESGIKASRYYYLLVNGMEVPVIARRKKEISDLIGKLKKGAKVRIYGKVKEFRQKPARTILPHYYIEFDHLMVLSTAKTGDENQPDDGGRRQPRRPFRR